ncbi:MAG: ABC transporter ATP-binding protein/permease [Anaerolineales bacterium]|nr:ABC transporter ATP-binding protein/permease [Anaerolineales bacterium]MCX7756465.1 ABC transporter ATP-binding protein/permease [Anaerolineales bacterium]MDW8278338.1 ABC transporter ATP-binding protein [Anaerolineales bacterium]
MNRHPLLRLRFAIRPYRFQIVVSMLNLTALTALSLYIPSIIRDVIDEGLLRAERGFLVRSALLLLGLGLLTAVMNGFQRYLSEWISGHIGYDLRNRLYNHIQNLSFSYHDHAQTGQLISRCIEDVRSVQQFIGSSIVELSQLVLLLFGALWVMLAANWQLTLIAILPIFPLVWMTFDFGNRITALFFKVDTALGDLSSRLQENVTGVQVVRAFAREEYEMRRFDETNRAYYNARIRVINTWSKVMPTTDFFVTLCTILILWFGGRMVLAGTLTVGELVAFNAYVLMLATPAQQLTWLVNAAGEAAAGARRVFEVLDTPIEIASPPDAIELPVLRGEVEFRDVWLTYQDEKKASLRNINLHVRPNQLIALIGPTGSGKTSLINLIPRFYDVTEGAVLVDGVDVRRVELSSLRRQIGIVLQTSLLFSDTIRANIAYGRPDATEEEIIAAAQAAQAHEFIIGFEKGYDTVVGERGVTLSGGQRQRVAIARALLMNPRILILDDSLSNVDTQTEQLIQRALDRLMEGRTTFVIAHRLSTVRRADRIVVMDKGQIVQIGTHEELLAQDGLYREIHDLQLANAAWQVEAEPVLVEKPVYRTKELG